MLYLCGVRDLWSQFLDIRSEYIGKNGDQTQRRCAESAPPPRRCAANWERDLPRSLKTYVISCARRKRFSAA